MTRIVVADDHPVLRDGLRLIEKSTDVEALAATSRQHGVYMVPAFVGLGAPYWDADKLAGLQPWTDEEIALFLKRQARIVMLGYVGPSEYLAEMLVHRDRDGDERKLCIECAHAGPGRRCAKNAGFLLEQLQRCDQFA